MDALTNAKSKAYPLAVWIRIADRSLNAFCWEGNGQVLLQFGFSASNMKMQIHFVQQYTHFRVANPYRFDADGSAATKPRPFSSAAE